MAEQFASGQVLYLNSQLRVAPLNVMHSGTLECSPRRGETLKEASWGSMNLRRGVTRNMVGFVVGGRSLGKGGRTGTASAVER